MHSHDTDLIAALAEGSLRLIDARAAEEEIGACARCSADLAIQREALAALRGAPVPHLDLEERTALRAAVAEAVGLPIHAPVAVEAGPRRRIPWPAISVAAISLAAIVAIVPVMGLLTTGIGSDDAGVALDAPAPTSPDTAAAELAPEHALGGAADDGADLELDAAQDGLSSEPVAEESVTSTAAPATTTTTGQRSALLTIGDLDALIGTSSAAPELTYAADAPCAEAAAEVLGPDALAVDGGVALGDDIGVAYALAADGLVERLVVLLADDCSVVFTAP